MRKTATLNLRIRPEIKVALEQMAENECRSLTGLVEWLVTQRCEAKGISIPSIVDDLKSVSQEAA